PKRTTAPVAQRSTVSAAGALCPDRSAGQHTPVRTVDGMASLSVHAAAEHARTSDRTVRRWIAEHKLPATRTADGWTVDEADLADLLDGRPSLINGHSESVRPPNGHADGRPADRPSEAPYLADLVRQLAERAEANAAAAAMWQARAEMLAGQLDQAQ